jgi:protein-S-isoprenylcysteine O-methyltransferase Ste14
MIGIPLTLLGLFLGTWGMITLSFHQSLGLKGKLVTSGLYRYSRNPQYVCFILFYLGLMVMANSSMVYATGALVILMFALAPFSEEPWLREQYGEEYREYLMRVPRYLGSGFNEVKREDKRTRAHV